MNYGENVLATFECEKLVKQLSFRECIQQQKTANPFECSVCARGRNIYKHFLALYKSRKPKHEPTKPEEAVEMVKKKCPKCSLEASNRTKVCPCGYEFYGDVKPVPSKTDKLAPASLARAARQNGYGKSRRSQKLLSGPVPKDKLPDPSLNAVAAQRNIEEHSVVVNLTAYPRVLEIFKLLPVNTRGIVLTGLIHDRLEAIEKA